MDQNLQNQLTGAILKVLPVKEKPVRKSYKKSSEIVKKSVKGKTKNVSKEQGFRQYLKYTDPLLLNNNELDQSDLAKSFGEILNVFTPQKMNTEKIKEVERFVALEKPVDTNDVKTEVKPELTASIKKIAKDAVQNETDTLSAVMKRKLEQNKLKLKGESVTKISKIVKGNITREAFKNAKETLDRSNIDKRIANIESSGSPDSPLAVGKSPKKELKLKSESANIIKKAFKKSAEKNQKALNENINAQTAKEDQLLSKAFDSLTVEATPQRFTKKGLPDKRFSENKGLTANLTGKIRKASKKERPASKNKKKD